MIADARLAALRRRLADDDGGAVLITGAANMRYLTGWDGVFDEGINAACLITAELARFYTDARYIEAALGASTGTAWIVRAPKEDLYVEMCDELRGEGVTSLRLESSVPYGRFRFMCERFSGNVLAVDRWVEELRQVKEQREIDAIAAAAELTDRTFEHMCETLAAGATEDEMALELECFIRHEGSDGVPFEPIVASGPNAARPHARPSDRRLAAGDLVVLDFGARIDGYCSDMTRTVVMGAPDERAREVHAAVLEANEAGRAAVAAGRSAQDVDAAARAALASRGLGDAFTHGLGHGVGMEVHEIPAVNARNRDALREGMVVTVEPGAYVPGWGGVRIEDLVVVESGGHRLLSHAPRGLIEIS